MQFYFVFASAHVVTNTLTQLLEFKFGLLCHREYFSICEVLSYTLSLFDSFPKWGRWLLCFRDLELKIWIA